MAGIVRAFPLTPLQEGMLYHGLRRPGSGLYHGQLRADLEGPLDVEAFRAAWAGAIRRHEALRTFFAWERRERPLQVVRDEVELPLRVLDWSGVERGEAERRWWALVEDDLHTPLDLTQAPLMRVYLVRTGAERHRLLWGIHHAVADGWSAELVVDEILEELEAARRGVEPDIAPAPSYAEFVGWLESREHDAARAWWTSRLAEFETPTPLPTPARSGEDPSRASEERLLETTETNALKQAAGDLRVTLATLTTAAWAIVLGRHTGARDVVFGVTNSERPAEIPGVERAVGLYLSTLPARIRIEENAPVQAWLERLQLELSEARQHSSPGLSDLKRWSAVDEPGLFHSLVAFGNYPKSLGRAGSSGALRMTSIAVDGPSDLPLTLLAFPSDTLTLELVRDPVQVTAAEAHALLAEVAEVMHDFTEARQVGDLLESAADGVPDEWTRGTPLDPAPADVVDRILEHVRERPDALALRGPHGTVSWGAFGRWTEALAGQLIEVTPAGAVVGVLADRSPAAVAAMIATLRAGRTYVPLDAHAPAERLAALLEGADAVWVRRGAEDRLPSSHPLVLPLADVPDSAPAQTGSAATTPAARLDAPDPDSPAYVVYTSGSTGTPKGVVVTRANLAWSTAARFAHYDSPPEVFLLLSPMHVDSSVAGIYWTLAAGGTLVLPPYRAEQDAESLGRLVGDAGVTHTLLVPSLHGALLESVTADQLESLRSVVVAGEACPDEVVRRHRTVLPGVPLHNEYGPSEATVWATVDDLTAELAGPVTIGRPVPGARVAVVDASLRPVPVGVTGELVIAGPGVAQGYLGRQDLTDERFVVVEGLGRAYRTGDRARWRADGRLEFLGRADDQFKIRGHRVEAGEVEEALRRHPAVDEAVVGLTHGGGQPALAAWLTMAGARVAPEELKAHLAGRLPAHMVPVHYAILDSMPRTPAGKLDRRAVQARGPVPTAPRATSGSASRTPPGSATERALAAVWSDVLGLEEVGIHDDFFELGGDSLSSIRVISRAARAGVSLRPELFFESPTIAALAAQADEASRAPASDAEQGTVTGEAPLTPIQSWFFERITTGTDRWNQTYLLALDGVHEPETMARAVARLVDHHDALRLALPDGAQGRVQRFMAPPNTPPLRVAELGEAGADARVIAAEAAIEHADLDSAAGGLFRAVWFRGGPGRERLLLVAHHLVVDAVSWGVLLEDLATLLAPEPGATPDLPAKTTSALAWARGLERKASEPELPAMARHWSSERVPAAWSTVPTDIEAGPEANRVSTSAVHRLVLDPGVTAALVSRGSERGAPSLHRLLVAGLTLGWVRWSGADGLQLDLESVGRDVLGPSVDVSRTVGWFTVSTPVVIALATSSPDEARTAVDRALDALPLGGAAHGLARYLHPDAAVREALASRPPSTLLFNYLGTAHDPVPPWAPFRVVAAPEGLDRASTAPRAYTLEINAWRDGETLVFAVEYSTALHRAETVAEFATQLARALDEVSRAPQTATFDLAGLDAAGLEHVADLLAEIDEG